MNFWQKLVNPNDSTVSSKTFIGLCAAAILFLTALCNLFFHMNMAEYIWFSIVGIVGSVFALNTALSFKKMDGNLAPTDVTVNTAEAVNVSDSNVAVGEASKVTNVPLPANEVIG